MNKNIIAEKRESPLKKD